MTIASQSHIPFLCRIFLRLVSGSSCRDDHVSCSFSFQSSNVSEEEEGVINQQGVHDLFSEVLFEDPADFEDDSTSGINEDEYLISDSDNEEESFEEIQGFIHI